MEVFEVLPEHVGELVQSFLSTPIVGNLNVGFTQYDFWFFVALILFVVISIVFVKKQSKSLVPQGHFVNGCEAIVEYTKKSMTQDVLGPTWRKHFPFIATLFLFILTNNIIGMIPGCHPGTGTIGVTFALALISFVYFIVVGIKKHGVGGYLKTFSHGLKGPMAPVIWLIEVFSAFLRLITLAVRLFCNLFAGHIVMGTFAILTSLFATQIIGGLSAAAVGMVGISALWQLILLVIYMVELVVAGVQAFVFAILSAVYIQISEEEE